MLTQGRRGTDVRVRPPVPWSAVSRLRQTVRGVFGTGLTVRVVALTKTAPPTFVVDETFGETAPLSPLSHANDVDDGILRGDTGPKTEGRGTPW